MGDVDKVTSDISIAIAGSELREGPLHTDHGSGCVLWRFGDKFTSRRDAGVKGFRGLTLTYLVPV